MAKKKSNMFGGRTGRSMERSKTNFGYLKLPSNMNVFKPEGGTEVVFDIVPYRVTDENHIDNKKYAEDAQVGELWWKRPVKIHRDVGPDGISVVCPTTIGKKCPICEYGAKRRKEGADWDELKEIFPKDRTLFYIVPLDTQECDVDYTEGEVHIMDQSDHIFTEFLLEEVNRDVDNDNFPDPYDGLSLRIYWRSKKLGKNKYAEASKIDFEEREEQYDDKFLDEIPSLDEVLVIKDYKELEALYMGMADMDDEDVDDQELEEEPPRRRRKSSRDEKPPRRSRREEPEEEEEEEEDEPPRRSRKAPARERKEKEEEAPRRTRRREEPEMECPFDHEFGTDHDEFNDCENCDVWQECKEAKRK